MVTQAASEVAQVRTRARLWSSPLPAILLVGVVALLARLLLLWRYPFDGLYGQDAYFYLTATRDLVKTWTDPALLRDWLTVWGTPPISVWPLGYHAQMALVGIFTGLNATAGQLISLAAGTLTPVLTSVLTLQMWRTGGRGSVVGNQESVPPLDPRPLAPLLAGLVMAVSPLAVGSSLVVMTDMAGLFWAMLGVALAVRYLSDSEARVWLGLAAGLCLGVASVTRYIYPLLLLPVGLFGVLAARSMGGASWRAAAAVRILPVALPVVTLVGLQLLHNWAHPTVNLPSPVIGTWNPANAWQSQFDGPDGHKAYGEPMAYFFIARPLVSPGMLGLALAPLVALGVVALVRARAAATAGLLLGWWLLFAAFYSGNVYQAGRFVLSYLPPMAVFAGIGLAWALSWAGSLHTGTAKPSWGRLAAASVIGLCLAGLAISAWTARADFRGVYADKEDYLRATRCVQEAAGTTTDKPVFSFGVTFTLAKYTRLRPRDLYYETPATIDAALAPQPGGVRAYLILPLRRFEEQWGWTPMGASYHHLRDAYRLEQRACQGSSFTLFLVR